MTSIRDHISEQIEIRWQNILMIRSFASYFDPRFKKLKFLNAKEQAGVMTEVRQMLETDDSPSATLTVHINSNRNNFFDYISEDDVSSIENKIQLYIIILLIPTYSLNNPMYKIENPLSW